MGNFSSITTNGNTQTRTANQQNEITSISSLTTPTYDTNGNLTTDELGQTYKYNAWNRLVQVKNSVGTTIASYAYDGMGRRIQETHGSTVNDLFYSSSWQVLEERTGGVSTATVQYVWSPVYVDALILRDRSTQNNGTLDERLWVQRDANWNVTALVNSSGSVVERYDYDPYGLVTYLNGSWSAITGSAYAWVYGFQGLRLDTATGNNSARRRDYRPTMQRWAELDPTGIGGGDTNFYRAEGNNPANATDPSGLKPQDNRMKIYGAYYLEMVRHAHRTPEQALAAIGWALEHAPLGVDDDEPDRKRTIEDDEMDELKAAYEEAISRSKGTVQEWMPDLKFQYLLLPMLLVLGAIRFGNNPNQRYHTFRHVKGAGMNEGAVETAILGDLSANSSAIKGGLNPRTITVGGQQITYHAFKLPDGTINVGRITLP